MTAGNALAQPEVQRLVGSQLSIVWGIPFVGMLLSIALLPLIAPRFWEHHFAKIAAFWSAAFLLPCAIVIGPLTAATEMSKLEALEKRVSGLSAEELTQFRQWFAEFDAAAWGRQIDREVNAGKLDALADEALRDYAGGKSSEF